jgi:cell shape-determining protein MreC
LTKAQQDLQRWMSEAAEQEMSRIQIARSLTEVQKRYLEALKRVMELEETLEQFKGAGIKIPEVVVAAKPVDGYVLAVSRQPEFNVVILNVGREKGVREGMEFTVYRENQFVGKVRVQSVDNDWSWAISLREFEQMPIRAGDLVSNRLSRYR